VKERGDYMIYDVHRIGEDNYGDDDKYVVRYVSGRKKEYFGYNLPKTVREFIEDKRKSVIFVPIGGCYRYF